MSFHFKGYREARRRIYARDQGMCRYCGQFVRWDDFDLDHIIPRHYGGGHEDGNLSTSHRRCNRQAGQALRQPGAGRLPWARTSRW